MIRLTLTYDPHEGKVRVSDEEGHYRECYLRFDQVGEVEMTIRKVINDYGNLLQNQAVPIGGWPKE